MRIFSTKYEGWCKYGVVTQCSLYRDLFNQNGMDFVTEISFWKTSVIDEKMLILAADRASKSVKVSVLKLRRRTITTSPKNLKRWWTVHAEFILYNRSKHLHRYICKNWTFWLVEKFIIWRYIHPARSWLLSSPSLPTVAEWSFQMFERPLQVWDISKDGEYSKWLQSS